MRFWFVSKHKPRDLDMSVLNPVLGGGCDRRRRWEWFWRIRLVWEYLFVKTNICTDHNRSGLRVPQSVGFGTFLVTNEDHFVSSGVPFLLLVVEYPGRTTKDVEV